jgi:predicted TIM-barrel enzyme
VAKRNFLLLLEGEWRLDREITQRTTHQAALTAGHLSQEGLRKTITLALSKRKSLLFLVLLEAQVLARRHYTQCVGVSLATTPSLDADDCIATVENLELHGIDDAPLQAAIDVFLPWDLAEVGLGFVEEDGVDAAVQMRVLTVMLGERSKRLEENYLP